MSTRPARRTDRWTVSVLIAGAIATLAAVSAYAIASGAMRFAAAGVPYPGAATSVVEFAGHFAGALTGALCLGLLTVIVTTTTPDEDGRIDSDAFRLHLWVGRIAICWLLASAAMVLIDAANAAGVPVSRLVTSGAIGDAIGASESARGWCAATVAAAAVTLGVYLTVRWVGNFLLLIPAGIGVIAVPVTGNPGEGPDHDLATSAAIVLAIAVAVLLGIKVAGAVSPASPPAAQRRQQILAAVAGTVAVVYGAMLTNLMVQGTALLATGYGRLALAAGVALTTVWLVDVFLLARSRATSHLVNVTGAVVMIAVVGAISAMAVQPAPRFLVTEFTIWDVFLGYQLPGPANAINLLTYWRFDPLFGVAALVLALAYLAGVIRLRRRGDAWPMLRTIGWVTGCLALLIATSSGVRAYGSAMFSVHMAEHMALNMFVPVLLVLGAPVTLALRALPAAKAGQPPGPREWVLWLVHSRVTRFLASPFVAFILFVGSLYLVYFTPLFDTFVRYHWGHELMTLHFLLVGYLFYWGIIGVDPGPRRLPFLGRLGLLFAVMPFHAFFGIATMTMTSVLGGTFYGHLAVPWVANLSDDQHLGGAIAWGSSELPVVIVVVALVSQWARQDRSAGARHDRHIDSGYDDDFDAYNAMLRELSRTRE